MSFHPGNDENEATMSLQVISGEILFESFANEIKLKTDELVTLHQQLAFKVKAINDTICLLTMVK